MRIVHAQVTPRCVPIAVPYRIAGRTYDSAAMLFLVLRDDAGTEAYGAATPMQELSGDDLDAAVRGLEGAMLPVVVGTDVSDLGAAVARAERAAPGARAALAALDIALHDLHAKHQGVPLVRMLGGARRRLFTSVTVGIDAPEAMVEAAQRHVARGFRALKVKIGEDAAGDLQRLRRIRAAVGPGVRLRVDANEGYTAEDASVVGRELQSLGVELFEQPVPAADRDGMRRVALATRVPVVADEPVRVAEDLPQLAAAGAASGANVKLMKCGGVAAARRLDRALCGHGWSALVGCMDESRASIAAAAHFAAAAASIEWIDLDGHLDLAEDPFTGGVELVAGELVLSEAPGTGVQPLASV